MLAKEAHRDFNAVLRQYVQERFLYRLSVSPYNNVFILKGGLLLLANRMSRLRPTKDIDFLGLGVSNDPAKIKDIVGEIAAIEFVDGIIFNPKSLYAEKIAEDGSHDGVRVKLEATLSGARTILQIDIGFGDIIVAGPIQIEYPVLLDMPPPKLQVYSKESSIAEKFQALVKLNIISSRMKDVYDILFHAESEPFIYDTLRQAITTTFDRRETALENCRVIFSKEFSEDTDKHTQWRAFLNRNRLDAGQDFAKAVRRLEDFLGPVCIPQNKSSYAVWDPASWRWGPKPRLKEE